MIVTCLLAGCWVGQVGLATNGAACAAVAERFLRDVGAGTPLYGHRVRYGLPMNRFRLGALGVRVDVDPWTLEVTLFESPANAATEEPTLGEPDALDRARAWSRRLRVPDAWRETDARCSIANGVAVATVTYHEFPDGRPYLNWGNRATISVSRSDGSLARFVCERSATVESRDLKLDQAKAVSLAWRMARTARMFPGDHGMYANPGSAPVKSVRLGYGFTSRSVEAHFLRSEPLRARRPTRSCSPTAPPPNTGWTRGLARACGSERSDQGPAGMHREARQAERDRPDPQVGLTGQGLPGSARAGGAP